jgi:tetratricopeptide (TPR) repeat protein
MFIAVFLRTSLIAMALSISAHAADTATTRAQALKALEQPAPEVRRAGIERLAEIGAMADADRVAELLYDDDAQTRQWAAAAMWQIWSRSGDPVIDALYQRGVQQMEQSKLREAVATFTDIIKKKPAFAEGWNKRATLYFMLGELDLSLKDCDEVVKRNPKHFGALSGYGQIYLQRGEPERALDYFERALKINPNLTGLISAVKQLQQQRDARQRNTI